MARKDVETVIRYSPLEIPKILIAHYKAGVPCNFVAEPSTVKSEGTMQASIVLAQENNREFFEWNRATIAEKKSVLANVGKYFVFADIRASETDIGELRLQDLGDNGHGYLTFKYNLLFEVMSKPDAKGILFFDEMNLAPNMIKAQFYKIINDKAIGDIPISEGVLCVSAGNEAHHSRAVTADAVPLVLRRGNYFLRPLTAEEYVDYAARTEHDSNVIGYIGFQPNDLHNIEYDVPESIGQPCPRTWTRLSQILKANKHLSLADIEMFATGLVGQGVAKKFSAFIKSAREINLAQLLAEPDSIVKYDTDENIGLMYAIIAGIVEKFRTDKKVLQLALQIAVKMRRVEFGAYLLRALRATDESAWRKTLSDEKLVKRDVINSAIQRYGKYFDN